MKKTHLESMAEKFPVDEVAKIIDEQLDGQPITYESVMMTPLLSDMLQSGIFPAANVMTNNQMVYHFYCFQKCGGRLYEIRDSIAHMLLNTKLDIDSRFLKSPFPEIILTVPDNLLTIHNEHTGEHRLYTIYVNFYERSETEKTVRVLCVGRANSNSLGEFDDALYFFRVHIEPGKVMDSLRKNLEDWNKNSYQTDSSTAEDVKITPRLFQFVLNILLYITSSDSDVRKENSEYGQLVKKLAGLKSTAKKNKLEKRIAGTSRMPRYVVGGSVILNPDEQRIYNAVHGKHSYRYEVGGHWRMQWYGSGDNKYQKPKWLRPHWRGPEAAEILKSVGVLK